MIGYTLQSNLFALIILFIVYKGSRNHVDYSNYKDRAFLWILITNAIILTIDSISIFFYDVPGKHVYVIQSTLKMVFFALNPLPGYFWTIYVYDYVFHDARRMKRLIVIGLIPMVVNVLIAFASIWGGYFFVIGEGNSYHRGSWFLLVPLLAFSYTIFAFFIIFIKRKQLNRKEWLPLLIYAFPPIIGGLLQTFVYGMVTLWPSLSISLLIIYVFIQSKSVNTDFLTGLNNRRAFDNHIEDAYKWKRDRKEIAGFMMDMDHFKHINDTYGHRVGDTALIEMSRIIKESFRKNDFLARLGGDEFAAIIEIDQPSDIEVIRQRLNDKVEAFNRHNVGSYQLSISCGSRAFDSDVDQTLVAFFEKLDSDMYEEKTEKKSKRRSG